MDDLLKALGPRAVTHATALKALRAVGYDVRVALLRELTRSVREELRRLWRT
jgi:cell division inhibitor SulA